MNELRFVSKIWGLLLLLITFSCGNGVDAAGDEKECEPGSIYRGSTADQFIPPEIRTMSDLDLLEGYEKLRTDLVVPNELMEGSEIDSLGDLRCLKSVSGICSIGPLRALTSLEGLENLAFVGWVMVIWGNDNLTNVDGFLGLESVGKGAEVNHQPGFGSLSIGSNNSLRDLKGLASLSYLEGGLFVRDNKSLPTCEAVELKEQLEKAGWTGEATICGNLPDECGSEPCPNE